MLRVRYPELTVAQRLYDREQVLQSKGISTPQALEEITGRLEGAKAALAAARAEAGSARARVEVARVNLDNCSVRAPFEGRITQKLADAGDGRGAKR